ncbi:chromophore lyase CpcT/CpeT [Prochlorococcus marinus]|uniref:Chromophore lyase CpcT/CpeT n=1 Tax=Prochlorococcus marinus XMU1408 TaxID=2213228 RepID=A0A318REW8_PROMR|nr:chromophore lyase CpcT/CpeT [Prochlorococcus marinus]MBW3041368.1 chorismate-binding protein [Prochlorococcus marinus str. XMU1408]PYE02533.1 chorismate-binding protein [Prochlorococcus marinus XMU1408]
MKNKCILEFAKIISGIFSNKEQALDNPKKFAHIQIHIRPLYFKTYKCYAFYSEQRYQHDIWNPYRQSINKLSQEKEFFILSNYKIQDKERFTGGALDISILNEISKYKLDKKSGCSMHFRETNPGNFSGNLEPGNKCYIKNEKDQTYVKSKVILNKNNLISEDSGHEIETDKKVWGSSFGPLIFKRIENFDYFIDRNWK